MTENRNKPTPERYAGQAQGENRERLDIGDGYIYDPDLLKQIRSRFADSRVVVIDANGVLMNEPGNGPKRVFRVNQQAKPALHLLREAGYELVLWSSAPRDYRHFLEHHGLMEPFDLAIFRENYQHNGDDEKSKRTADGSIVAYKPIHDYDRAIQSTPWLSTEEQATILSTTSDAGSPLTRYLKTPQVLFPSAAIIDDGTEYIAIRCGQSYIVSPISPDRRLVQNTADSRVMRQRYPFIQVRDITFNAENTFSPDTVKQVIEKFPPTK